MTNYDIEYLIEHFNEAMEHLDRAFDDVDGVSMHYTNGDMNAPSFDKTIVFHMLNDIEGVRRLMNGYITELNARKH